MTAREAYSLYVERAGEGAVPPQMGPYPRSRGYSGSPFRRYMAWMMLVARVMEPNHFS